MSYTPPNLATTMFNPWGGSPTGGPYSAGPSTPQSVPYGYSLGGNQSPGAGGVAPSGYQGIYGLAPPQNTSGQPGGFPQQQQYQGPGQSRNFTYGGGYNWNLPSPGATGPGDVFIGGVDYTQLQQQTNAANRPDQYNAFGASQQVFNPATGQWEISNTLAGPGAAEYGQAQKLASGLNLPSSLDTSQLTPWGTAPSYDTALASTGEKAAMGFAESTLAPQQAQATAELQSRLQSQGLHPGDKAYDDQVKLLSAQQGSQTQQAQAQSTITGGQLASQQTGAEATAMQAANSQRMQQIQEQLTQAGWTTNEINQLLGGPAVSGAPGAAPANPTSQSNASTIGQNALAQQQMSQQQQNNLISGIGQGGAALASLALLA